MFASTGPTIAPGHTAYAGSNRVALDVAHRHQIVCVVHWAREKSILPEMSGACVHSVDVLRVQKMGATDCFSQGLLVLGSCNDMDVIGHQAVTFDSHVLHI